LISARDEFDRPRGPRSNGRRPTPVPIGAIFHGRVAIPDQTPAISIGPIGDGARSLRVGLTIRKYQRIRPAEPSTEGEVVNDDLVESIPLVSYRVGLQPAIPMRIDDSWRFAHHDNVITSRTEALVTETIVTFYINSNSLEPRSAVRLWQNINLTDYHKD